MIALSGALYSYLADAGAAPVEQSRFAGTTDVAAAKAIFKQDPRVRLLMDNGAGPQGLGLDRRDLGARLRRLAAEAGARRRATSSARTARSGPSPAKAARRRYTADPSARPKQTLPGDGAEDAWKAQPPYNWAPVAAGKGLGFVSSALAKDVVIAGPSSLDVYLKSSARDTDLQVTLSEVRPDGNETYVQNGWLRASHRKLDARRSTALDPVPDAPEEGRRAAPEGQVRARARADLPGGARVPCGVEDPGDVQAAGRRPPALGLRHRRQGQRAEHGRASAARAPRAWCCRCSRAPPPRAPRCRRPPRCAVSRAAAYAAASNGG